MDSMAEAAALAAIVAGAATVASGSVWALASCARSSRRPTRVPAHTRRTEVADADTTETTETTLRPEMELSAAEKRELNDVRFAFAGLNEPVTDARTRTAMQKQEPQPTDVMHIMDTSMRRLVRCLQQLPHFQELSDEGKMYLVKYSMVELLTLRGVLLIDNKMEHWSTPTLPGAKISVNMFDRLTDPEQKERLKVFYSSIHESLRYDSTAITLFGLVVLFDNSRAATLSEMDQEVVRRCHELYYNLLQRYVESVHYDRASEMMRTLPIARRNLARINEAGASLYVDRVKPNEVPSLPAEFFRTSSIPVDRNAAQPKATNVLGQLTSFKA